MLQCKKQNIWISGIFFPLIAKVAFFPSLALICPGCYSGDDSVDFRSQESVGSQGNEEIENKLARIVEEISAIREHMLAVEAKLDRISAAGEMVRPSIGSTSLFDTIARTRSYLQSKMNGDDKEAYSTAEKDLALVKSEDEYTGWIKNYGQLLGMNLYKDMHSVRITHGTFSMSEKISSLISFLHNRLICNRECWSSEKKTEYLNAIDDVKKIETEMDYHAWLVNFGHLLSDIYFKNFYRRVWVCEDTLFDKLASIRSYLFERIIGSRDDREFKSAVEALNNIETENDYGKWSRDYGHLIGRDYYRWFKYPVKND